MAHLNIALIISVLVTLVVLQSYTVAGQTILMKRTSADLDFQRTWTEYEDGFGNCGSGDCWVGLKTIHTTCQVNCNLRLQFVLKEGSRDYNYDYNYTTFMVGDAKANYNLTIGGFDGDIYGNVDKLSGQVNGMNFTTKGQNNGKFRGNCAEVIHGGWWYSAGCSVEAHLTGDWNVRHSNLGLTWGRVGDMFSSFKSVNMTMTPS